MNLKRLCFYSILLSILSIATFASNNKLSEWEKTKKALQEKTVEVREVVGEKLKAAKKALKPYAQEAKEKIEQAAEKVKKAVTSGIEKIGKKTEEAKLAAAEKMLRVVAAEPDLPIFNITNMYGKQLKLKIRNEEGKKIQKIYINPGDNFTMNAIPEKITASYRGIKDSQNGLVFNPERLKKRKGTKHIFLTVWLSMNKAQFDAIAGIDNNIKLEQINKAQEAYDEWWEEFEEKKAEKSQSSFQEFKKSAKGMRKEYKEVARQTLEVKETLKPYTEMATEE